MSRATVRKELDLDTFRRHMKGSCSTSVNESTIDESPMVYKAMQDILDNIADTVEVVKVIKSIYNFKAYDNGDVTID